MKFFILFYAANMFNGGVVATTGLFTENNYLALAGLFVATVATFGVLSSTREVRA